MPKLICPYRKECDGPCEHARPHTLFNDGPYGHDCTQTLCKRVSMIKKVYCREMTAEEEIVEAL